ncbi:MULTISPECIES: hypothetical protein [Sphingobium]|uniref:YtxH domain-containing protein n=1 Tax=Sphingobium tyrosinilyticum TaxID=2715436 RepID=A0ABV9F6K8_9SPHN|nr:hypothetical protein [Sphingobium sp. EP60837]ANI78645.1 hypothetical protein EP837_02242 [Sphingobium sp. EP60837]
MIRTLIFGAIAGYVGKKLYDEGKLTEFKEDLVSRYQQARSDLSNRTGSSSSSLSGSDMSPAVTPTPPRHTPSSSPIAS